MMDGAGGACWPASGRNWPFGLNASPMRSVGTGGVNVPAGACVPPFWICVEVSSISVLLVPSVIQMSWELSNAAAVGVPVVVTVTISDGVVVGVKNEVCSAAKPRMVLAVVTTQRRPDGSNAGATAPGNGAAICDPPVPDSSAEVSSMSLPPAADATHRLPMLSKAIPAGPARSESTVMVLKAVVDPVAKDDAGYSTTWPESAKPYATHRFPAGSNAIANGTFGATVSCFPEGPDVVPFRS